MATRKKVSFEYVDELRYDLGLFVSDVVDFLGISRRTWFRWGRDHNAPKWAYVALRSLSGDLSHLGWKGWYIKEGELYHRDLNPRYYSFGPGELVAGVFCDCPAHKQVRRARVQEQPSIEELAADKPDQAVSLTDYRRAAAKEAGR